MSILGDARKRLQGAGYLQEPRRSGGGATWESNKADVGVTRGTYTSAAACAAKGGTWIEAPGGAGYCELPKPKKRGGGGKPKFGPKKKPSKALIEEYEKNLAEVKQVLMENIDKEYLTKEDAVAIYEETKQLMKDAVTGDLSVDQKHVLDALRSGEDNSIVETASNLVDYETTKKINSGQSPDPNLPGNPANYPDKDFDGKQYFETKKQEALNAGDWSKAEEFGATEEEIINHGGIKIGEEVVTEGPETWTETQWAGEPTTKGDEFGIGDTGEFDTGGSYDEDPIFADDFNDWQNDEYDWASEEAFDAWGNWEDSYSDTGWTDDSGGYTDDGWSENTGGIIKRRPGTNPAMYRAGGGMSSQQERYNAHPGGPRGTDTVPAWLTEGEFVIDRDSTEKFAPLLKQINDWEPTSGPALKRKMRDDKINAKAFGKPMYRNEGGGTPYDLNKKQAFLAKSARARGANIGAGLDALGKSNQNQAAILGQAGLKGTPLGKLENVYGAVGAGAKAAGQIEGEYQGDLANITRQQYEDEVASENLQHERDRQEQLDFEKAAGPLRKELKALEDGNESLQVALSEAKVMADYVVAAGPAWQIFADDSAVENLSGVDDKIYTILQGGAEGGETLQLAYLTQKGLKSVNAAVGTRADITQEMANAVGNAVAALDSLATAALKAQGPGVKTNFDFQVARQTITNLTAAATQVVSAIEAFIQRTQRAIDANNKKIQELTDEMEGLAAGFGMEETPEPAQEDTFNQGETFDAQ